MGQLLRRHASQAPGEKHGSDCDTRQATSKHTNPPFDNPTTGALRVDLQDGRTQVLWTQDVIVKMTSTHGRASVS